MAASEHKRFQLPGTAPDEALLHRGFRLLRQCGEGGSADIYEAEQICSGQRVALKRLRPEATSGARSRLRAEAALLAELGSERVVRLHEDHTLHGFFTMELLDGESLERASSAPMPPMRALHILRQVAQALQAAHERGVVHCDLKPENVFVAFDEGGAPSVKLLDFGIARRTTDGWGGGRELFGTPLYMSPEQAQGRLGDVGVATDVWALAQLAFRLLSGRSYYPQEPVQRTLLRVVFDPVEPPSRLGCCVSGAFDAWFLRSCHRDPRARYRSVIEQVDVLSDVLAEAEVELAPCEERPSLMCDGTGPTVLATRAVTSRFAWVAAFSSLALSCYALLR